MSHPVNGFKWVKRLSKFNEKLKAVIRGIFLK